MYSYLFRNVTLIDGSGKLPMIADVGITGNRVSGIGARISGAAEVVVDGDGLVLSPGFIDIHSHTDLTAFKYPLVESKAFQGVTLEVVGNCGIGPFPVQGSRNELADFLGLHDFHLPGGDFAWCDLAGYAERLENIGLGIHLAPLVGHAPLRISVMGTENRAPSASELERMRQLLAAALEQGAWGMSTGLIYPPGSFAATDELIYLAKQVARYEGLYASHIRNEGEGLMAALDEAVAIGRESSVRVQISHLKAMGKNRGKVSAVLAKIDGARSAGIDVAADQYPYAASATSLSAVVPQWAHAGGVRALLRRLSDPDLRTRLVEEIDLQIAAREGAQGIMVSNVRSAANRAFSGLRLAQIAASWNCSPAEAVIRLLVEEEGSVGAIFFSMADEDVQQILAHPNVAVGSDGHGLNAADASGEATHPRSYGTFPRVLGHYVREKQLLSLATAVHKMTGLPASRLGFTDRGLVAEGYAADLVLFDPAAIRDVADYADPHRYATGVVHLLVEGQPLIWEGALTGRRPGRVLRKRH